MDFGLDKLVEMIEERFGKWASTGLLALVGIGAAALAIHAFFSYLVFPVANALLGAYAYLQAGHLGLSAAEVRNIGQRVFSSVVAALLSGTVLFAIFGLIRRRLFKRVLGILRHMHGLKRQLEIILETYDDAIRRAQVAGLDIETIERDAQNKVASDPVLSEVLSHQSPQDTGPEKQL